MPAWIAKHITGAKQTWLIGLTLVLATVAAYWGVWGFQFLNYDDFYIFFANSFVSGGLTWTDIQWACTTNYYEYWHPLMWISHMLDCQLFGLRPGWHHAVNLALHVANALLVFAVFRRMTGLVWRSAVVAALFALHPLHVESVAWLAERKDLLSTFFALLSLGAYVRYAELSKNSSPKSKIFYWLALFWFLLGLLTKPMVVTLPFVLLLLDYWPLNRIYDLRFTIYDLKRGEGRAPLIRLLLEKLPFFALMLIFCWTTWYSVSLSKQIHSVDRVPWSLRLSNIPVAYARYLWKTIWPAKLAGLYPLPDHWPASQVAVTSLLLVGLTWIVLSRAGQARYLAFGWFVFLGTIVPTIGIVPVGLQAMADRYMYLPSVGLFAALVWSVTEASARWRHRAVALAGTSAAVLGACAVLTSFQLESWRDSLALWKHCLALGYESALAHYNLGGTYLVMGDADAALEQYRAALQLDPAYPEANLNYGVALLESGRAGEATNYFAKALVARPDYVEAHDNLGSALVDVGNLDAALEEFNEAIRLRPNDLKAYIGISRALSKQGKSDEAVRCLLSVLRAAPAFYEAHYQLGLEYLKRGDIEAGIASLKKAAEVNPDAVGPHIQLAQAFSTAKRTAEEIAEYREVLVQNPNLPEALNNLAWALATCPDASVRNGAEAVKLAERACQRTRYEQTVYIGTLSAAYAEAGQFEKAVETSQKACNLASAHGEKELLQKNQALLERFKNRQAYHEQN